MPRQRWSKERVLAELKRFRHNGPQMHTLLDAAARRHFGSVREALRVAGLPCGKRAPPYTDWSTQLVIKAIRRRHGDGKCLDSTFREDPSLYAAGKRLFGTWSAARAAAGCPRPARGTYYSADEVRLRIIELYERELPLTFRSHGDINLRRSAKKHFGSWSRAVKSLGLGSELRREWTEQAVVEAILYRQSAGLNLCKTYKEDKRLFAAAVHWFGNWHNALKSAGLDVRAPERWTSEKIIERMIQYSRESPNKNLREIDFNLAYAAGRYFGSLSKAWEAARASADQGKQRCVP